MAIYTNGNSITVPVGVNTVLTDVSVAYKGMMNNYIAGSIFPKVEVMGMAMSSGDEGDTIKVKLTTGTSSVTSGGVYAFQAYGGGGSGGSGSGGAVHLSGWTTPITYAATGNTVYVDDSTMPWRTTSGVASNMTWNVRNDTQEGKNMNIKAGFAAVRGGFLALVYNGSIVVWESKKRYKTAEKAIAAANKKINTTVDDLFN